MAKTTINEKNLSALGNARLCKIILDQTNRYPLEKRRLKYELAAMHDHNFLSSELTKRTKYLLTQKFSDHSIPQAKLEKWLEEVELNISMLHLLGAVDPDESIDLAFTLIDGIETMQDRLTDKNPIATHRRVAACIDACGHVLAAVSSQHPIDYYQLARNCLTRLIHYGCKDLVLIDNLAQTFDDQASTAFIGAYTEVLDEQLEDSQNANNKNKENTLKNVRKLRIIIAVLKINQMGEEGYLDKKYPKKSPKSHNKLIKLCQQFHDYGLHARAHSCLTLRGYPKATTENFPWFQLLDKIMRIGLKKRKESDLMRWDYFCQVRTSEAIDFYMEAWKYQESISGYSYTKEDAYHDAMDRVHQEITDHFDMVTAVPLYDGMGYWGSRYFNEFMIKRHRDAERAPLDLCLKLGEQPSWENSATQGLLIIWRAHLTRLLLHTKAPSAKKVDKLVTLARRYDEKVQSWAAHRDQKCEEVPHGEFIAPLLTRLNEIKAG